MISGRKDKLPNIKWKGSGEERERDNTKSLSIGIEQDPEQKSHYNFPHFSSFKLHLLCLGSCVSVNKS